jgi:hypothetical protein
VRRNHGVRPVGPQYHASSSFFNLFTNKFAVSYIVHTADVCRGHEGRLTAKFCLPAELCREGFAGGSSQQRRCREWIRLCREEPAHDNVAVSGSVY